MTAKTSLPAGKPAKFTTYGPGPRGKDHTAIVIDRGKEWVTYISIYDGMSYHLHVGRSHTQEFDQWYAPSKTYPVEKLAELYLQYALRLGGTEDALGVLGQIINISEKDKQMAVAKKSATDVARTEKPAAPKAKTEKPSADKSAPKAKEANETKVTEKVVKQAKATKTGKTEKPAPKAKEAKVESKDKKPSAAQRFQDLIMEGKKTDDEIFAVVQKEFGLDDSKRSYVKWYRNNLKKLGKNPPEAKTK